MITDKVVEAVRKDLLDRSNVGINKYGTTLDGNSGNLRYWLNHAYEECLDQANYLKRAIMELDGDFKCHKCYGNGLTHSDSCKMRNNDGNGK